MTVALKGSSPMALTAGILLLSRSRSFGQPLDVVIVGDPGTISEVRGPALVHAPVLASCGVGRELGSGGLVIVPGPAAAPLAVSLSGDGTGDWFRVDRAGDGQNPPSRAFVALCRSPDRQLRSLGRELCDALASVGCPPEPALIDLLCSSPAPPLLRVTLALRAGQAMTGAGRSSITRYLSSSVEELPDPLPGPLGLAELRLAIQDGRVGVLLDRLHLRSRDRVADWLQAMLEQERLDELAALVTALAEVGSHVAALPPHIVLPPLLPATDAVAVGLGAALGASEGQHDANRSLTEMFRFLGGRFSDSERFPVELDYPPPPEDTLLRWQWFCKAAREAADTADTLWRRVIDPVQ